MLLARQVQERLDGPWNSPEDELQWFEVRANLDNFVQGGLIGIARDTFRAKSALLGQLDPPKDEVWEVRCRDPKPGIRIFGRFAAQDLFVALRWEYRVNMKGRHANEWHWMIEGCQEDWRGLFSWHLPLSGNFPDDYISGDFYLV
jgi:hypothetical protein